MNVWDRFTLKEEYESGIRDQYGRFRYYLSSDNEVFEPNVSKFINESGFTPSYPNGKKFAACLSHDIDFLPFTNVSRAKDAIYSGLSTIKTNRYRFSTYRKNQQFDIEYIIELEKSFNAKSSFYFLSLDRGDQDFSYRVTSLKDEFSLIQTEGFEMGLHGGHTAYNDSERMSLEKGRLGSVIDNEIVGYRGHYLRFDTPRTWEILANNDFVYDTTLSYPDVAGFRNGMCYPFRPFSLESDSFINIIEIPLIVMDACLFGNMHLSTDDAFELSKSLIEKVESVGGLFTLLWHNLYMKGEYLKLYKKLLDYLVQKDAWITSSVEVAKYWKRSGFIEKTEEILTKAQT